MRTLVCIEGALCQLMLRGEGGGVEEEDACAWAVATGHPLPCTMVLH